MKKFQNVFAWTTSFAVLSLSSLQANPTDPTIVSGDVSFSSSEATLDVNSSSTRAIVEWESFSNEATQTINFNLPSSTSAILNRVTTADTPSAVLGTLESNGIVYLINPSGILFGPECVINAASFLASTLDCDNTEFLNAGNMTFIGTENADTYLNNYATITASEGDVILLSYQVNNQGTTNADNGTAAIGAGVEIVLQPTSDTRILITPHTYLNMPPKGIEAGGNLNALRVELAGDGNAYEYAISHDGIVDARGTATDDCVVTFNAVDGSLFEDGTITALNDNDVGGEIQILGKFLEGGDNGLLYASGQSGGGGIYFGGGLNGTNPSLPTATTVEISNSFQAQADGLVDGNGGIVVFWSDGDNGHTEFAGFASATGGLVGGDGGYVQVNGVQSLDNTGSADVSAPYGTEGTKQYGF